MSYEKLVGRTRMSSTPAEANQYVPSSPART